MFDHQSRLVIDMFQNSRTEQISVIYKRKDGHYGLLEPQFSESRDTRFYPCVSSCICFSVNGHDLLRSALDFGWQR
jgi:hypothetical protein